MRISSNHRISLSREFARQIGAGPGITLLETLVRLPGGGYGVLVMRPPESYADLLVAALAPSGKGGTKVRKGLRRERRGRTSKAKS